MMDLLEKKKENIEQFRWNWLIYHF
jgi:hypothetical protein